MGTGTTAAKVAAEAGLEVEALQSGPLGGDLQIGARIVEQECDCLVFLWDPKTSWAHDSDVKALLRIATMHNILLATNLSTADLVISNPDFAKAKSLPEKNGNEALKL
jgi:methylglyoxal synthase